VAPVEHLPGATEIYVAVPEERDIRPVRKFATFTEDLHTLADWLIPCSIKTVAIESTGVYWIALFQILERRGLEAVCAVRSILRHRDILLKSASRQVLLMQKALTQTNLQLHNVISDITGLSGFIDAILMGEGEPMSSERGEMNTLRSLSQPPVSTTR
jgi:transposase